MVGNRKLIYRAVRRWMPPAVLADDMIGDCQIVLIQAVAAYNPWMGIRFSTYAFTCLMRACRGCRSGRPTTGWRGRCRWRRCPTASRATRPARAAGGPAGADRRVPARGQRPAVAAREARAGAAVQPGRPGAAGTLEQVGRELGLSKERVRQVQAGALGKLRKALPEGLTAG